MNSVRIEKCANGWMVFPDCEPEMSGMLTRQVLVFNHMDGVGNTADTEDTLFDWLMKNMSLDEK